MILQNLKTHLTGKELASQLDCTESRLRKTFSKIHGVPIFHFLRRTRMHFAREQILKGIAMKAVAIDMGMDPSNFPKDAGTLRNNRQRQEHTFDKPFGNSEQYGQRVDA